jgi:hypothetical protein
MIIPIGVQCTNAFFKQNIKKTSETLPFDWMFSTPKFVFQMLELLLDKNMDIQTLVVDNFFACEKRATYDKNEHYYSTEDGFALYNVQYKVIFPHDSHSKETVEKYVRRFERLKTIILCSQEQLCFLYTSQSSLEDGNFTIDGETVLHDVYLHLSNIYSLLSKYNSNFKMVVFDAIQQEDRSLLDRNIILYPLTKSHIIFGLLPQMEIMQTEMHIFD